MKPKAKPEGDYNVELRKAGIRATLRSKEPSDDQTLSLHFLIPMFPEQQTTGLQSRCLKTQSWAAPTLLSSIYLKSALIRILSALRLGCFA